MIDENMNDRNIISINMLYIMSYHKHQCLHFAWKDQDKRIKMLQTVSACIWQAMDTQRAPNVRYTAHHHSSLLTDLTEIH